MFDVVVPEDDERPLPRSPASTNWVRYEPIGVCAAVTPWNFPIQMAAWKMAPAIAAGNAVVIKPASFAPLTTLEIGRLCLEAGIPEGVVNVLAGPGAAAGESLVASPLVDPRAVVPDAQGRVYILERSGNALRVVQPDGTIWTVAGTGLKGNTGDGGGARQATLNGPKHLCMDLDGSVVIADTENHVIRRYLPREGKIVRLAGTGTKGSRGVGGPPLALELNQPHGVHVHADGSLYVADSSNHRVLKIER